MLKGLIEIGGNSCISKKSHHFENNAKKWDSKLL